MFKNCALLFVLLFVSFFSCESLTNNENTANNENATKDLSTDTKDVEPKVKASPAYGVDISKFQGDEVAFLKKSVDDLSFIICKATEGITYTDPKFSYNWKMIPEQGFIRGSYHFYRSADDPVKQAANYVNAISDLKQTDIAPIVDFEGAGIDPSQSVELIQKNLLAFLQEVEAKLNRRPMIYTNPSTGNKYLDNPSFGNYALWVADYDSSKSPVLPQAWESGKWTFWQKTSSYELDNEKNDFDVFNGSKNGLVTFISNY